MTMKRASCCKNRQGGQPVELNIGALTKIVSKVCSRNDFEVKGQYGNVMIIKIQMPLQNYTLRRTSIA